MLKKLIPMLFGFLILTVTAHSATNGSLDSLGISINDKLGIPRAGNDKIADSVRNFVINESITTICVDFPAYEKIQHSLTTARNVALPADYVSFAWAIRINFETGDVYPLEPLHPSLWYEARGEEVGSEINYQSQAIPRNFWIHADSIWMYPEPVVSTDSLIFAYYAIDVTLSSGTDSTNVMEKYREAVIILSCYKLLNITGRLTEAQVYLARYNQMKLESMANRTETNNE